MVMIQYKDVLLVKENPTVEIRLSHNHFISTVGFPLLVRHLFTEPGPMSLGIVMIRH